MNNSSDQLPHENLNDAGNAGPPAPRDDREKREARRVVDAEVVENQGAASAHDPTHAMGRDNGSIEERSGTWHAGNSRGFFYSRTFSPGKGYNSMQTPGGQGQNTCLAPCISFALFLVCLVQFGFLAGLGFVFFHTIGSVLGALRDIRRLGAGLPPQPWPWRMGNWILSFMLTAWFAGGLH